MVKFRHSFIIFIKKVCRYLLSHCVFDFQTLTEERLGSSERSGAVDLSDCKVWRSWTIISSLPRNQLPTLCLNFTRNRQMHCTLQMFCTYFVYLLMTFMFDSIWMDETRAWRGVICSIFSLAAPDISLSDFYSASLFTTYTRDLHRAQRTDLTTHLCVQTTDCILSCGLCVWVCEYRRSLTILWMNRSPGMFLNVWASSVTCIFVINLCFSTVDEVTLAETSSECDHVVKALCMFWVFK